MSNLEDLVWEHKYRPRKIDDVILPDGMKTLIKEQLARGNLPNMLFSGNAGIGKTTVAYAIANELDADVLFVNASLEGNIDTLRTKITQFVSTVSFTDSRKIVILDESDHMSASTQPALRSFCDQYSDNATFILTCNYPNRIIEPLQSRLTKLEFKFNRTDKQSAATQMLKRACYILDKEGVTYDRKAIAGLVAKNFPDFRSVVVALQSYSASGNIDSGILAVIDDTGINELVSYIKNKEFGKCRSWITNNQLDHQQFYRLFYDKVSTKLVPQSIPQLIMDIGEFQFRATHQVDQEINQVAFITHVMKSCQFQ